MKRFLLMTSLLLMTLVLIDCTRTSETSSDPPAHEVAPGLYAADLAWEAEMNKPATGERIFVADVIWYYETEHEVQFGNFPAQKIVVPHLVEDAWTRIALNRVPKPEDFTEKVKPPYPDAKCIEIQTKRRWPKLDPDGPPKQ